MIKWGLEEEVFITEPEKPTLESLYYLAKLLKKNPGFFYYRTASNFSRGEDIWQGLMSCIEISTSICSDTAELLENLKERRKELISVCDGLIVPMGHLLNLKAPTNTAALQIHISGMPDYEKTYANLAHFMPILALISANSPGAGYRYFGKSYRMAKSYAIGPLTGNPLDRFQDIIYAKRLNTLEIRIFDPFWDLERMQLLLSAIEAILNLEHSFKLDIDEYRRLRSHYVVEGLTEETASIYEELSDICELPIDLVEETPGDTVWALHQQSDSFAATYSALDNAYRTGILQEINSFRSKSRPIRFLRKTAGIGGYYIPRLPYMTYKYLKEK